MRRACRAPDEMAGAIVKRARRNGAHTGRPAGHYHLSVRAPPSRLSGGESGARREFIINRIGRIAASPSYLHLPQTICLRPSAISPII
jgi:hypothetical protein